MPSECREYIASSPSVSFSCSFIMASIPKTLHNVKCFEFQLSGYTAFFTMVYFVKSLAFSRVVFALSSVAISLLLIAYRELIPLIVHRFKRLVFSPERIVILGSGAVSAKIIKNIEAQKNGDIIGIVWDSCTSVPSEYQGYPVLGTYETLKTVFQNHKVDTLLIATQQSWYSWVIDVLSIQKIKNVTIRWASHELFEKAPDELPDEIELLDFAV